MVDDEKLNVRNLRNIIALGFVSFFTDVSSEMSFSILPIFILKELGASLAVLGLIEGVAESTGYIFRMLSGVISDWVHKRKLMVFVGYAFSSVVKPFFALAQTSLDAFLVRFGDRVGKGIRTSPRDALISESISEKNLGKGFGLHRTLDQLGAIIGPMLAFVLIPLMGIRSIFWVSLIPALTALIVLIFFVKEKIGRKRVSKAMGEVKRVLRRDFVLLLLIISVFSVGAFNFSFILVRAEGLGLSDDLIPIVYAVINVSHMLIGIPAGSLADKIGKERVLLMGYAVFSLTALLLIMLSGNVAYGFLIALVFGVYFGTVETVQRAMIPKYSPSELRATAYGIYYLVAGLSFLIANTVVGVLWDQAGIQIAFGYSFITSVSALLGILAFMRLTKKAQGE